MEMSGFCLVKYRKLKMLSHEVLNMLQILKKYNKTLLLNNFKIYDHLIVILQQKVVD